MIKLDFLDEKFIIPVIQKKFALLVLFSVASITIFFARVVFTESYRFAFLNWNLFLAWVPVCLILIKDRIRNLRIVKALLIFTSFLFLPNSFYVLTDFIHAQPTLQIGLWFDVIMISFYALCSLMIGYVLVESVWRVIVKRLGSKKAVIIVTVLFMLIAFGVYLGRFLRFNTWDIIDPINLFDDLYTSLTSSFEIIRALLFTMLYGFLLEIIFFVILDRSE